jgi:hypothetical protein
MVIHNEPVHYALIPATAVDSVDYSQTLCTREGVRFSLDGSKAIVKWTGSTTPPSVSAISEADGPYTRSEILAVVSGVDWEPQEA